jgi:pimeloyl-ACP methyl ester carboxylesterase
LDLIRTDILEIAFGDAGPSNGIPVLLLHGWPDAARGWKEVSRCLQADGFRTITPFLSGSSRTEFLSKETPRFGAGVGLARDAVEFADPGDGSRRCLELQALASYVVRIMR